MKKVILYIANSLDGYIAGPNHELDWLESIPNPNKIDHGYGAFIAGIDTLLMGRSTYDVVRSFDMEWPYSGDTYVMTRQPAMEITTPKTHHLKGSLPDALTELKHQPGKDIWLVGGGVLFSEFLKHGLLDEIILSMIPVVLGDGIPLFPPSAKRTDFGLIDQQVFETGIINLHYRKKA